MILRPEYRSLADAATAAGLDIEAGVPLRRGPTLPLVVMVPPLRVAPIVAAYPPGQWLPRGADESLTDYARRVWPVLDPILRAILQAGIVPLVVPVHECRGQDLPAEVIERIVAVRNVTVCFAQGLPGSDAIARALAAGGEVPA